MGSFTENFFNNQKTFTGPSKNTKIKKKNVEYDTEDFTSSFFSNYSNAADYSTTGKKKTDPEYTEEFVNEYNSFIDRLNTGIKERETEAKNKAEQVVSYYENNKDVLKKHRSDNLVYNWNLKASGGDYFDYGYIPIQDKNGYLKQKDKDGNVYWVDAKNDELYDANYNKVEDDRITESGYNNLGLKYEYSLFNKFNPEALSKSDKLGLSPIEKSRYMSFIVNDEEKVSKLNRDDPFKKKDFSEELPYKTINDVNSDKKILASEIYEKNFEKLNKALENGDLTTANNALETINQMYFGREYNDGIVLGWAGYNEKTNEELFKKFNNNVEQLQVINNAIENTSDAKLLQELNKEKGKLELENTLIQYNRICAMQSSFNKIDKINTIQQHKDEVWEKVGKLWNSTFENFEDGYQAGDILKTTKKVFNNTIQTIVAEAVHTNDGIQSLESLLISDLDDSEFKDKYLQAIIDVSTYMIPYVGQARFIMNMAEPIGVVESFVTQEGSATIDSSDGNPRVASGVNAIGAIINGATNFLSNYIFKNIRVRLGEAGTKKIYENSGRAFATLIFKDAAGEASEEFVQTFAEVLQNTEDPNNVNWKEVANNAFEAAIIAAVTTGIASGTSIAIDSVRTGDLKLTLNNKAEISNVNQDGEIENIRLNKDLSDVNDIIYTSNDTKNYEKINENKISTAEVVLDIDEKVANGIAEELSNNQIVSILDSDAISKIADTNLNNTSGSVQLADTVIDNNTKTVLVSSKEMETYLKSLNPNLVTYVFDPKSETFMDDIRTYVKDVAKQNIVPKNVSDFTINDYKFSPSEMTDINKMVNEYINKGNIMDSVNKPTEYKLNPITVSDITDSDINTIMNSIKTKFLDAINSNKVSKETAQKKFKLLNNKLSEYALKTKENRTYLKDSKNNIIVFSKKGNNIYEAVNTMPKFDADLSVLANVKTNGNIINGNLSTKVDFSKKQMNAVNTIIDKLKLKGNYITPDSTYKDVATLIKSNREMSKEILQALNSDGLIEGKNKVMLYTAYDNLDNGNLNRAVTNTNTYLRSEEFKNDLKKKTETTAPKQINKSVEESKVDINEKPISIKENAYNPNDTTELNNIEFEKMLNDAFSDINITDKKTKIEMNDLKTKVRKVLFDRYVHINDVAKANNDYDTRAAIADLEAVASDAQIMIDGAQIINNEVVGKSLKQIYSPLKGKKQKQLFEKYMMLELNIERENANVDKVFDNLSKKQSRQLADGILNRNPKFKEIAADLQRYNNNLLDMLVDGGVIDESLSNKLKDRYKYYMPIYSSDLSTFADLNSDKYFKNLKVNDTIQDVTKTGKKIQTLEKSLENKTYNVLSAIAKNKLIDTMAKANYYESDNNAEMIYYDKGKIMKMNTSKDIVADISNNSLSHIVDTISEIPVIKQLVQMSNLSYKFILDPVYQLKNLAIDFQDSQFIYSKDKKNFAKNYKRAIMAVANNSEVFNEFKDIGLGEVGTGIAAPKVEYDENGNVKIKQNKFQRIYANLEAMPKLAEYLSLKDKYMKQARIDYENGKYSNFRKYKSDIYNSLNNNRILIHVGNIEGIVNSGEFSGSVAVQNPDTKITKYKGATEAIVFKPTAIDYFDESKLYQGDGGRAKIIKEDGSIQYTKENPKKYSSMDDFVNDDASKRQIMKYNEGVISDDNKIPINKDTVEYILVSKDTPEERIKKFKDAGFEVRETTAKINNNIKYDDNINNLSFNDIQEQVKLKAKIEAQDVNLNFNSGGTGSKALSKLGFKFLNAGMLGFDKFVTHVGTNVKTPKGMGSLLLEFTAVGATTAIANSLLNGDDEEYDKLPYYYKNNYYMIKLGEHEFLRIPKGRVQTLYNVLFEYSTGLRKEDSLKDYVESLNSAFDLAVMPPAVESASPTAVYKQLLENKDAFGNEIYSNDYDDTATKIKKSTYHLLSNYFGRYGRIVKDITDGDSTTDLFNEFDYYKDTTKANKHYNTVIDLVNYYNKNNVKTLDDKAIKKYIDTQNYALRTINSEISQGKKAGQTTKDLSMKYAARDDLLKSIINNYKNYDKDVDEYGNTWYYFDEHCFMYNEKTEKFVKKY